MDNIKEAFIRVREDIEHLRYELDDMRLFISTTNEKMKEIHELITKLDLKLTSNEMNVVPNEKLDRQTDRQKNLPNSSLFQTQNKEIRPLNDQNKGISIGNRGVQTDRQTDRQTDQQTQKELNNAINILNSLDNFKKELRLKFKRLTTQEILIFSTIYQIEEEKGYANYKSLAERLNLSESSIRDYVRRLLEKNIPLEKKKINNKEIKIIVSPNLKKLASLNTILDLRSL